MPDFAGQLSRKRAPHLHRPRPPLFQRRIVEKRVGVGIQISCENGEGIGVSTATQRIAPASICLRSSVNPSRSIASVKQSARFRSRADDPGSGESARQQNCPDRPSHREKRRQEDPLPSSVESAGEPSCHERNAARPTTADIPAPARHKHRCLEHGGKQDLRSI